MLEFLVISFLILLTILRTELIYIIGKLATPAGKIYLGTVHHPPDYFYYLSQMAQGKSHWVYSTMQYTSEKLPYVLVGWQHVLLGKIFPLTGIGVIEGYQIAVIIFLFVFLVLSCKLLSLIFPQDAKKRILAFFFFVSSTPLFKINQTPNGPELSFFWYWYNHGFTQVRFAPTPHHLIANSFFVLILILVVYWFTDRFNKRILAFGLVISSIILTSISPTYWGLLVMTLFVFPILIQFRRIGEIKGVIRGIGEIVKLIIPAILTFLPGIPAALYVRGVFQMEPYSYSHIWESTQQVIVNPLWLVLGSGLVIVFGAIGAVKWIREIWLRRESTAGGKDEEEIKVFGVLLLTVCSFFYMSVIPQKLGLTNIRFWLSSLYVFWGALGAEGLMWISTLGDTGEKGDKRYRGRKGLIFVGLIIIYFISILPTYYISNKGLLAPKLDDAFYYIPKDAYDAYFEAAKMGDEKTVYLVQWPFDESFPALTGRKSFFGNYLLTINSEEKNKLIYPFFDGKMTENEAKSFLDRYKIKYILGYPWTPKINDYTFIKRVGGNGELGIYKVDIQ